MPGCKPLSKLTRPSDRRCLARGFSAGGPPGRRADVVGGVRNRQPARQPDAAARARTCTATSAWRPTARRRPKGRSGTRRGRGVPRHARRARSPTTSASCARCRRSCCRPTPTTATRCSAPPRTRRRRTSCSPRSRASSTSGHGLRTRPVQDRPDGGPLRAHRRAAGRRLVFDLRVPGLLPRRRTRSRPSCRSSTRPRPQVVQAPWYEFKWFANDESARFEMVLALRGAGAADLGDLAGQAGAASPLRAGCATACWRSSASCRSSATSTSGCGTSANHVHQWDTFHYYVGLEVLQRAVLRPAVRVRRGRRLRGARPAPPRRAAQGDEPAHQHDGGDAADPGASRGLQEALHDASAGRSSRRTSRHFRGKHDVKRWEEAQTDHGYNGTPVWNILGTTLANTGPAPDKQIDCADLDRSAVHRRADADDLVGVRLADDVRRAGGVRHEFPVTLLLDGRRVPALGLAVLLRGRRSAW